MARMPTALATSIVGLSVLAAPAFAASPNDVLPEAPAKATLIGACTMCHQAPFIVANRRSADQWGEVVASMVDRGAPVSLDQQDAIVAYLSRYFSPRPAAN